MTRIMLVCIAFYEKVTRCYSHLSISTNRSTEDDMECHMTYALMLAAFGMSTTVLTTHRRHYMMWQRISHAERAGAS